MTAVTPKANETDREFDELMIAVGAGNEAKIRMFVADCLPQVAAYLERRGAEHSEALANLVMSEFIRNFDRLSFETRQMMWGYIYSIARTRLIDEKRRAKPSVACEDFDQYDKGQGEVDDDVVNRVYVQGLLSELTDDQRNVVKLRFLENHSQEETARIVGKSVTAVKGLQKRALVALASLIAAVLVVAYLSSALPENKTKLIGPADSGGPSSTISRSHRSAGELDAESSLESLTRSTDGGVVPQPGRRVEYLPGSPLPTVAVDAPLVSGTPLALETPVSSIPPTIPTDSVATSGITTASSVPSSAPTSVPGTTTATLIDPVATTTTATAPSTTTVVTPTTTVVANPPPVTLILDVSLVAGSDQEIITAFSERCLAVKDRSMQPQAVVHVVDCTSGSLDLFNIEPVTGRYARVRASHSDLCLAVDAKSSSALASIVQDRCDDKGNTLWRFLEYPNGTLQLQVRSTDMCLTMVKDPDGSDMARQAPCVHDQYKRTRNQRWDVF